MSALSSATSAASRRPWALDFVVLSAIWGSSFMFMRIGAVEFGPLPTAASRVAIAALCLLPPVLFSGLLPEMRRRWKHIFVVGLLNSGIPFACLSFALLSITTGLSSILNATVPMFGALVAWLWLKDRPNGSRIAGLVIGFAGVALLAWRTTGPGANLMPAAKTADVAWAVAACITACLCYATSASYARRYLAGVSPLVMAAGSQLGATVGLALPAAWLWPAVMPSATAWLALLAVGVVCTGLAYVLFFRLIDNAGPSRALSVTFLVPVFAVLYGVLFLGEKITPWMVMCAVIIVCGTALSTGLLSLKRHRAG
jgi:drug/metabolite transporter (DMT)-like permease